MVAVTLLPDPSIRLQERVEGAESYGHATLDVSTGSRVTWFVIDRINSRSMDLGAVAQYGLPGAALAVVAWLVYTLIRRGFRVSFRAEVPRKRT